MRKPTLYKHRGKWRARIWNGIKYKSYGLNIAVEGKFDNRIEATIAANKLAENIEAGFNPEKETIGDELLIDYVQVFWAEGSKYIEDKALLEKKPLSAHYLLTNRQLVKNKILTYPFFEKLKIRNLSKSLIKDWQLWLAKNGTSGKMINEATRVLRVPIKRAFEDDLLPSNPFIGMRGVIHKEKRRGILTPNEIKTLMNTPYTDPRRRLAVYLPMYCSMRMGEVRGLLWGDIGDGVIYVKHNWQEKEGLKQCKCGSEGTVPMPSIVANLLNELKKIAPCTADCDFVMSIKPRHPISREYLWEALREELSSIGINIEDLKKRNIVYHSLRHTFVTTGRLAGFSNLEIMAAARHKDEKMMERYTHAQEVLDFKNLGEKLEQKLLSI